MRIAVFGATGGLGREVVRQALEVGDEVVAHVRSPDKLATEDPRLKVVQGDLADAASIRRAVDGVDAVVSAVGFVKGQDPEVYGQGMRHIVEAMQDSGVSRLVAISGAGLELPGDEGGVGRRLIIAALKLFARQVLEGKLREWEALRDAPVDWTLVRVARMHPGAATGRVSVHGSRVSGRPMVSYADVAAFMWRQCEEDRWSRQAPFVSGATGRPGEPHGVDLR